MTLFDYVWCVQALSDQMIWFGLIVKHYNYYIQSHMRVGWLQFKPFTALFIVYHNSFISHNDLCNIQSHSLNTQK